MVPFLLSNGTPARDPGNFHAYDSQKVEQMLTADDREVDVSKAIIAAFDRSFDKAIRGESCRFRWQLPD
jgi:hypothetical protein